MKRALSLTVILALACGSGSSGPTAPETPLIAGTWDYRAANINPEDLPISCDFFLTLILSQVNENLRGTHDGFISCEAPGDSFFQLVEGDVVNGSIDGNRIEFDLDGPDFHNEGVVSGETMAGTLIVTVVLDDGEEILLTGPWVAVRD